MSTITLQRAVQLARFCLVGLICYVTNILVLAALCELLGVPYLIAYLLVFFLGNAIGYWLNKRFTFGLRSPTDRASMVRYVLISTVALVVSTAALHVLVEWMHVWYLAAVTIIAAANAPMTFIAHRLITYRVST